MEYFRSYLVVYVFYYFLEKKKKKICFRKKKKVCLQIYFKLQQAGILVVQKESMKRQRQGIANNQSYSKEKEKEKDQYS